MDPVNMELDRRERGESSVYATAFVWDEDFECYLLIYPDVSVVM